MSCQAEKMAQMYEMFKQGQLRTILSARNHSYKESGGDGFKSSYQGLFKPSYDGGDMISPGRDYGTEPSEAPRGYRMAMGRSYDIAPAKMPTFFASYFQMAVNTDKSYHEMPNIEVNDTQQDMLAEMIARARGKGVEEWMLTMQ